MCVCMCIEKGVTAKLTCAARRGPHARRVGEALVAQSGGGVGTHVLRGLGFQLQVTIPPPSSS